MGRYDILRRIEQLDPEKDHVAIYELTICYEFPWDITRALEVALYRTYCVPSISAILQKTGEFTHYPQKRYDDTALIINEMSALGYTSEEGRAAQRRMNRIHRQYEISNDDYLYVLSVFIYEPVRWLERFGWRKMSEKEKLASYYFWCEIGRRMNIKNIPESYEAFEQLSINYEREHFCYAESNQCIGGATRDLFLSWFPVPQFVRNLLKPTIYALLDDSMLDAFGFPHPPHWLRQSLALTLKARASALRFFLPRKKPFIYARDLKHRSYPHGYNLADLGPYSLLPMLNRTNSS
ncbi:MAG TPA: oxygenase MpaB family protein [Ktedonobacteraceae bacterium]